MVNNLREQYKTYSDYFIEKLAQNDYCCPNSGKNLLISDSLNRDKTGES